MGRSLKTIAAFALVFVAACSATFNNHGYIPAEEILEQIEVGVDDKLTVEELIGRPASTGVINDDGWYYIRTTIRNYTIYEPEVVERDILAISFDRNERVSNVETLTLADGNVVALNRRVTELPLRGPSFWQQLVSSLGNIDASEFLNN
ncbi:MAG: outer membrane protein assembly factor BamE [Pseudomonadota bacterium]